MQAQITSNPVTNLLIVLSGSIVIDGIILYYVYKKNKFGLGFKISLLVLFSALIPNISNFAGQLFKTNALLVQTVWGIFSIAVVIITIIYILNNIITPINTLVEASESIAEGKLSTQLPEIKCFV